MIGKIISSLLVGGPIGLLIYFIVEGPLALVFGNRNRNNNLIDDAIEKGHVVKATLVRDYFDFESRISTYTATYEYEVNSRKYKKTYVFYTRPSSEITLYWKNNPAKAETADALNDKSRSIHIYILCCVFAVFLFSIFFER